MIHHITWADHRMSKSAELASESAVRFGCNHMNVFLSTWFEVRYTESISKDRGAGYWIWKPHIIGKALSWAKPGEYVLYTDAGVEVINSPRYLIDAMDGDIMLFGNHYQHRDWCKREVFDALECKDGLQVQASAMLFRCSDTSVKFVEEWMDLCMQRDYISDCMFLEQYPSFQEHRHDQALLTAVAQKYNLRLHWWPAVYNDGAFTYDKGTYTDSYPPIFHHHRKRNNEW